MSQADTIFALSTPSGQSAVAIIRISGSRCMDILSCFFRFKPKKTRHAYYKSFRCTSGNVIDKCLVIFFQGPNSYTGEDLIEIQTHGSISIVSSIFKEFKKISNLRMANPGEFSLRSFYNNKQNLLHFEGINNLIKSETDNQRKIANNQIFGYSENLCKKWGKTILESLAHIDAAIEFSEEENVNLDEVISKLTDLALQIQNVLTNSKAASQIMNGIKVLIFGPPNAGKSSLFNLLCGQNRAIVSEIKGTTRDQVSVNINILNNKAVLTDSAGIRKSDNKIEKIGIQKTLSSIEDGNRLILVLSPDCFAESNKSALRKSLKEYKNKRIVVVYNKSDLDPLSEKYPLWIKEFPEISEMKYISVSCLTESDEGNNKTKLIDFLNKNLINVDTQSNDDYFFSEERHIECMDRMLEEINQSINSFDDIEICADNLRNALKYTNELFGKISNEEKLEYIFSNFCIGK